MKKRSRLITVLLVLTMLLSLAACGGNTNSGSDTTNTGDSGADTTTTDGAKTTDATIGEPQYGGSITAYYQEFANNFGPEVGDNRSYAFWFESLWAIDWGLNDSETFAFDTEYIAAEYMAGQIADTWEYDADAGALTVTLLEDVTFQDKEPYNGRGLVAEDVKWSYDRLLGTGSGWDTPVSAETDWPSVLYMIESVETDGDYTVIFNLKADYNTETAINDLIIANVNIAGSEWDALTDEQQSDWKYAAGTGPYILDDYILDNSMHFVKNENYYDYDERYPENKLPYIDEITLQVVTESANRLTQFISGELDWLAWQSVLSASEMEQLRNSMSADAFTEYNYYSAASGIAMKQTLEPLQDINVRKALQMAINSEEIHREYMGLDTDMVFMGMFDVSTSYSAVDEWSDELYDSYAVYDPEGAKTLLKEAGYPDGFTLEVVIFGGLDADLYALAQTYLAEIGVTMNITIASSPPEMNQMGMDPDDPHAMFNNGGKFSLTRALLSYAIGATENSILHDDTKFDEMLTAMNTASTMEERIELGKEADLYFAEQHWILSLGAVESSTDFISSRIQGFNGERTVKNWNMRTVMARVWVNE